LPSSARIAAKAMPSEPAFPSSLADLSAGSGPGVGCGHWSSGDTGCNGPWPPGSCYDARRPGHRCLDRSRGESAVADSTAALRRARDGGEGRIDRVQGHAARCEELRRRLPGNHRRHPPCHSADPLAEGVGRRKKAEGQNPMRAHEMEIDPNPRKSRSLPEDVAGQLEMAPRRRHRGPGSSGVADCRPVGLSACGSPPLSALLNPRFPFDGGLTRWPCGPPHRRP